MRIKLQISKVLEEDPAYTGFYSVTKWLDFRYCDEVYLFLRYLKHFFGEELWIITHNGKERSREKVPEGGQFELGNSVLEQSRVSNWLFDQYLKSKPILDENCCYCGYPICYDIHEDLKLLEAWKKPTLWISFGYDFFASKPLKTLLHSSSQSKVTLVYIVDVKFEKVICFNASSQELYPSLSKYSDFFTTHFPARDTKKVLGLQTWALRGLLKNRTIDFSKLAKHFSYNCVEHFKTVGACLNALSLVPVAEYSFLHHLQQIRSPP